jgi:hypothetical protein
VPYNNNFEFPKSLTKLKTIADCQLRREETRRTLLYCKDCYVRSTGRQPPPLASLLYGINYLCTYDLYGPVCKVFDAGREIMWGSGGVGAGNREFCGPLWNSTSLGSAVRKLFCSVKFLTTLPTHPPITLTHRLKPLHPSTPVGTRPSNFSFGSRRLLTNLKIEAVGNWKFKSWWIQREKS